MGKLEGESSQMWKKIGGESLALGLEEPEQPGGKKKTDAQPRTEAAARLSEAAEQKLQNLTASMKQLAEQTKTEEARVTRREELTGLIPGQEETARQAEEELSECRKGLAASETKKQELGKQLLAAREGLRFESKELAAQALENMRGRSAAGKAALEQARAEADRCEKELAGMDGRIGQLEKR